MSPEDSNLDFINSTDYTKLADKVRTLRDVSFDLTAKMLGGRRLRYAEVDVEIERKAGRIAPDEMYVPIHIIDTNIRREQAPYIQFVSQSNRAVILKDKEQLELDLSLLEQDLTAKLRYDGWQLPEFSNIDSMQSFGYGVMEVVRDTNNPGELGCEMVQFGDFAFIADTKDIQKAEIIARAYYFTKTDLVALTKKKDEDERWDKEQVDKVLAAQPNDEQSQIYSGTTTVNRSLYKLMKLMFRVDGYVYVAWAEPTLCSDWLRKPRKLFVGRRRLVDEANSKAAIIKNTPAPLLSIAKGMMPGVTDDHIEQIKSGVPASDAEYETMYPYFIYPYLITENNTIACLKGRIFLDQDVQSGATSLLSSTLTQARRSSGLYFSKDTTDPNDDFLMQKNVYFRTGALINGKIKELKLDAPDAQMFTAINTLISANQQETSQVNYAENNRQGDSRKTAAAIKFSAQQQTLLSGVQVTLFSTATREKYQYMCDIIRSRVLAGLIKVSPNLMPLYQRTWYVKPAGDVDVIEKQTMVQTMMQAWPVIQQTAAAQPFLSDLLMLMFPNNAPKYIAAMQQAQQQQQSAQAQQSQQMMGIAKGAADKVIQLSKHPEFFSETGKIHAYPVIEQGAAQLEQMMKGQK